MQNNSELINNLIQSYGYWAIFIGLLLETFFLTGFLVPGTAILIIEGYASSEGSLSPTVALFVSLTATLVGDNISFFIGRSRIGKLNILSKYRKKADGLHISNPWYLYLFQFTSITRALVPFTLGLSNFKIYRWWLLNVSAGLIFVMSFFGVGYVSSLILSAMNTSLSIGSYVQYLFNIIMLVIVLKYLYYRYLLKSNYIRNGINNGSN